IAFVIEHANRLTVLQALGTAVDVLLAPFPELEVAGDIDDLAGHGDRLAALQHRLLLRCTGRRGGGVGPLSFVRLADLCRHWLLLGTRASGRLGGGRAAGGDEDRNASGDEPSCPGTHAILQVKWSTAKLLQTKCQTWVWFEMRCDLRSKGRSHQR